MHPMALPLSEFPDQLRRNVDPVAPPPLRLMAARGLVPAAPREMAMMLYQLSLDPDRAIADTATRTMGTLPRELVVGAASARVDGRVLDYIVRTRRHDEQILETVLSNPSALDLTFTEVAGDCSERISEVVAVAEVRLLRTPRIIERLYMNANARMSTVDRLIDLAKRNGVKFELDALQHMIDDPGYDTRAAAAESAARANSGADGEFRKLLDKALAEEEAPATKSEDEEERELPEEPEEEKRTSNIATRLTTMTIAEKMRMAMLGSSAEREFLIKDSNRLVYMAAVTSPKVRLKDIQSWSANRLAPDGVLSYISGHRRYRRVYQIVVNLVNNPKTPVRDGLKLLPQLAPKDLKTLMKNRNVSHQLRRQAKTIIESRERKKT